MLLKIWEVNEYKSVVLDQILNDLVALFTNIKSEKLL